MRREEEEEEEEEEGWRLRGEERMIMLCKWALRGLCFSGEHLASAKCILPHSLLLLFSVVAGSLHSFTLQYAIEIRGDGFLRGII